MIEPRYYVIFGLVLVLLQLLIFATNRTFFWLCADKLRHQTRRWITKHVAIRHRSAPIYAASLGCADFADFALHQLR